MLRVLDQCGFKTILIPYKKYHKELPTRSQTEIQGWRTNKPHQVPELKDKAVMRGYR